MKKYFLVAFIALFVGILFGNLSTDFAYAQEENVDVEAQLGQAVRETLDGLNLSDFEALFATIKNENSFGIGFSLREFVTSVVSGEQPFSVDMFYKGVAKIFYKYLLGSIPLGVSIIIVAIMYGILKSLSSNFNRSSTSQIVYYACYGVVLTLLIYSVTSSIVETKNALNLLETLLDIAFPVLLTFTAALGGGGSVAVYQPMMTILTSVIFKIVSNVIFPLFFAVLVFTFVGNFTDNIKLDKLTKTLKSVAEWILGIVFSLFTVFVTAQGITGTAYDTVSVKAAKFALSGYVPILGGYLSDGFDLVLASCVLVKNAVGLIAIVILVVIVLLPIIKILVTVFVLRLAASVIEPFSDKKFSDLLYSTSKNMLLLIAILAGIAFLSFIMIMLVIYTCNFGVV